MSKLQVKSAGDNIDADNASWSFSGNVAEKFSDHVSKSVPFYQEGHELVCKLSDFFLKNDSICYELGVSTASLLNKLSNRHPNKNVKSVGIDIEPSMIKQAKKEISNTKNIKLIADDINLYPYEKSDFIVSYYTIQFIPPHLRQELINKIYESLNWGGAFIMFEKVRASDARFQDYISAMYTDYKLEQNYTPDEIIVKGRSLKGVLEPFSTQGNLDLLKRAGFEDMMSVMKWNCFEGFLAIK